MRSSTMNPPGRAHLQADRAPEGRLRLLVGGDDADVRVDDPLGGLDAGQLAVAADERRQAGAEVQPAAERREALLHRLGDLRVGHLGEQPGVLVDQVGLDAAVRQRGQHLHAERPGLQHDGLLHVVERLVELHAATDVLDEGEPLEVVARHVRQQVVPAGADDQRVPRQHLAVGGHRAVGRVDLRDDGLAAQVDAGLGVVLGPGEEEALEVGDLAPEHVGDAARRVGDVLELGAHHHRGLGVRALGHRAGADPRGSSADDADPFGRPWCSLFVGWFDREGAEATPAPRRGGSGSRGGGGSCW